MIRARYSVRWLDPDHAAAVSALEAQLHPPEHRAGLKVVRAQLQATADEGRNLSLGLFHNSRLVGFILAFYAKSRLEISEFFDAPVPNALDPHERTIYIADFVVSLEFRHASSLLIRRLREIIKSRKELRNLNIDAFSTPEYARLWGARGRFLDRFDVRLASRHSFVDTRLKTTLYWLTFNRTIERQPATSALAAIRASRWFQLESDSIKVGVIDNALDWEALQPHWDALLEQTGTALPQQRFSYLRQWWSHIAAAELDPFIVVAFRNNAPVAIAPLQIVYRLWLGKPLRCLQFIGEGSNTTFSKLMAAPDDIAAQKAIAQYLASRKRLWHTMMLGVEETERSFMKAMIGTLDKNGFCYSCEHDSPSRQLSLQKLADPGSGTKSVDFKFSTFCAPECLAAGLERYAVIEAETHGIKLGISVSTATYSFYKSLLVTGSEPLKPAFSFLSYNNHDVAGLLTFVQNDTLFVEHVIQRENHYFTNLCAQLIEKRLEELRHSGVRFARMHQAVAKARSVATERSKPRVLIHARRRIFTYDLAETARSLVEPVTRLLDNDTPAQLLYPRFRVS